MVPKYLRREVIAVLCIKAAALVVLYQLFFAATTKPDPDGAAVRAHYMSAEKY